MSPIMNLVPAMTLLWRNQGLTFQISKWEWYSLDVAFSGIRPILYRSNLAQIVFVSDATISSIFVDNIYFYNDGGSDLWYRP